MKPCPMCGAMLTAALADAVRNPTQPESCPKGDEIDLHIAAMLQNAYSRLFGGSVDGSFA